MKNSLATNSKPVAVKAYCILLLASAGFMALLGWSANAYYVPALCLLVLATLLWRGCGFKFFKWIILVNQVSGLVLILVLWLGEGLGAAKLDISAVMLLLNLLCGGPLISIWALAIIPALHKGKRLFQWFHPAAA